MEKVLREAINNALSELDLPAAEFVVEHPADLAHGDYATNVAMVVAKEAGKAPRELAEQILAALEGQIEYVEKIEIAGPGFINFHLHRDFFTKEIDRAIQEGEHWGATDLYAGQKILVEYTDPNPFKEFHIGHLFTNSVGESIARLLLAAGGDVKRVNYQGDVGMHVAAAVYGLQQLNFDKDSLDAKKLGEAYVLGAKALKENEDAATEIKSINKAIYEKSNEEINELYEAGRQVSLEYFADIYKLLGTDFNHLFFESEVAEPGKQLVLGHPEVFVESDGAYIFKGEEHGLHTRVFLNQAGLPTYEAKELALAKLKEEVMGEYDLSIVSTSNEINEYFQVLKKAMSFVYPDLAEKTEHIGHGTVRLASGKMSSRTGEVIAAKDFIEEIKTAALEKMKEVGHVSDEATANQIAIAAIKFATLKSNILQDSVFDKEQALSFEGDSGPYLQYTYARINSLLEKASEVGVEQSLKHSPAEPYQVERLIYQLPLVVERAAEEHAPHLLANYLISLAGIFNTFYATEQIADSEDEFAPYKAAVAKAVQTTIKNGLWGLGIEAPEKM